MNKFLRFTICFVLGTIKIVSYSQEIENPVKYMVIGSYKGEEENFNEDMPDNKYVFEKTGTVFFKIKDKVNNIYYGGEIPEDEQTAGNKTYIPIAGSYRAAVSESQDGVGSLYFTVNEGLRYTVEFLEPTEGSSEQNYLIILKIEEIKDGYFDILARSNDDLTKGMFWPVLMNADELPEDMTTATVTSVSVSSWDYPFLNERFTRVFYWSSPENATYHLSDWDEIIAQGKAGAEEMEDDSHNWIIDPTVYDDDAYCYQLVVVMNINGNSRRFVANSDRFTINSEGNPLTLRAYYLVQKGVGSSDYYTFPDEKTTNIYNVTNFSGAMGNSGNILFNVADVNSENVDFGNEEEFRFTDQVLIRSNKPYGIEPHMIVKFLLYNVTNADNPELLIDTKDSGNAFNNEEGRFMAIVEGQIKEQTYRLDLVYIDEKQEEKTLTNSITKSVVIPSPKIEVSYVEYYKGSDNTEETDNAVTPNPFTYPSLTRPNNDFKLTGARYNNLRQYVKLIKPNTTEILGQKMLDSSTGTFTYFYECYKDGECVSTVNLRFQNNNETHSVNWETNSPNLIPEELLKVDLQGRYDSRCLKYSHNFLTTVYDRWGDGTLKQIEITDNAPECITPAIVENSHLYYKPTSNGDYYNLTEDFKIKICLNDIAEANVVSDEDGLNEKLPHQSEKDYYYVVIVDKKAEGFNMTSPTRSEFVAKTGFQNYPEGVYTADQLRSGELVIPFSHIHGTKKDMVWDDDVEEAFNNPYSNQLQLRISYLYPFRIFGDERSFSDADNMGTGELSIMKALSVGSSIPSNLRGNVIMSKPLVYDIEALTVTTGVESIETDDAISISGGEGYITIRGPEGIVYTLDGRKVAAGEGKLSLPAGIYIVSAGNIKQKIKVW